jgi:hypothetical protein
MKRISISIVTFLLFATVFVVAEDVKTATIESVKAYKQGRIAYWEGRVPIYDGYPFYDITLAVAQKKYIVRYESLTGYYPSSWKVGHEIKVRMHKGGRFYLLNGEEEVQAEIVNARALNCVPLSSPPATLNAGPQVPCD